MLVDLGLRCWVHISLYMPVPLPKSPHEEKVVPGGPPLQLLESFLLPLL
jgi:hypothetical protein